MADRRPAPGAERSARGESGDDPALARIDTALLNLRHLWHGPASRQPAGEGAVELSTIWVVEALSRTDDGLTITELAGALDVAQSTGSRLVERAVAAGMVERGASATDGRRVVLRPTPAGRDLAVEARAFRAAYLRGLTQDWSEPERTTFATLLARFADAARTSPPTPPLASNGTT